MNIIRIVFTLLLLTYVVVDVTSENLYPDLFEDTIEVVEIPALENTELNMHNIYSEIKANNIEHPDIVLKQSVWESGWYKCTNCSMRYNNPFGFRHTSWVEKGNPLGYLKFDTWQKAVVYYKKWQKKRYKGGDYYEFLTKIGYAEDPKYISNLKSINVNQAL